VTADLRITWILDGHGRAGSVVEAPQTRGELTASSITGAPEGLLTSVPRLVAGERETRARFESEPTAYRWVFTARVKTFASVRWNYPVESPRQQRD
jgi:hypothetical protein